MEGVQHAPLAAVEMKVLQVLAVKYFQEFVTEWAQRLSVDLHGEGTDTVSANEKKKSISEVIKVSKRFPRRPYLQSIVS